jgi:leucyl-tRNA synthetase
LSRVRIDSSEVQLAGDQRDHGPDGRQSGKAVCAALGGLEQAVERFEESVGLSRLRPGHDAVHVPSDHARDLLHRLDLRAHHANAPLRQHRAHDVDLLAVQDFAQLLLVARCTGRSHRGHAGDQGVQVGRGALGQVRTVLQQRPAQTLEGAIAALLDPPRAVDRGVGVPDDMELVEGDAGIGQVVVTALDERRRHVDADGVDVPGVRAAALDLLDQRADRLDAAAFGHRQHPSSLGVGHERDVVVPPRPGGLVDRHRPDGRQIGQRQRLVHVALADRGHPMPALADDPRGSRESHLPAQQQHQRLEQQGEPGQLAGPRRLDLPHAAVRQLHPRHPHFEEALVLEEVQVPVALGHRVVHWMLSLGASDSKAAARDEADSDGQDLCGRIEVRASHEPRLLNTQRRLEQSARHVLHSTPWVRAPG